MKKLFLSSLFLIFLIISCGSPSECECKKEFEIISNSYSYLGSSLLDECMEVYKNKSFLNADCDNAVSSDKQFPTPMPDTVTDDSDTLYVEYEGYD